MDYIDYYKALGVDRKATSDEIGKAYKRLARKYHPDLNKDAGAEARFKEINEAYEVLKDDEKRSRYDALGANWKNGNPFGAGGGFPGGGFPGGGFPGQGPGGVRYEFRGGGPGGPGMGGGMGGFSSFFESLFGGRGGAQPGGFGDFAQPQPPRPQRGQDIQSRLKISLEDVYFGKKPKVTLTMSDGQTKRYDVTIPRTVRSGEKIRLSGQGGPGPNGAPAGDLYLEIQIKPHPVFSLEGDDLVVKVDVPAWDAALGAKVPVPTLDGEVKLTLPAGVASGQRLRLKGKGMPKKGGQQGDLYAELRVTVPRQLSEGERELFEQLRELRSKAKA